MTGRRHRLVSARKAAGFSQERLAEAVGVERTTVMRWERGETTPQPWARPKLAHALGISDPSLSELLDESVEPERSSQAPGTPNLELLPFAAGKVPAERQGGAPVVIPDSSSESAGSSAPRLSYLGDVHALVPRVVYALKATQQAAVSDSAALEDLNTVVEHYKRTFRSTPPAELYNEIFGVRVHAGTLLDGGLAANNRSDLVAVAGWLSNLLALVTHDLDDRAASLVWCADAERRSQESCHPELEGWAAHTRVLMSFYGGRAHEAVAHAQRGQTLAPLGTAAHAKLVAQEMRAWALLGNSEKVSSTRWRAEKAIAKLPPDTPTQGAFSISLAEEPPYTATSLLLLGQHKEAVEATRRVIATFYASGAGGGRREHPSGFARTHLILALALAGLGKLDEAYAAASMALDAPRLVWPVAVLAGKLDRKLMRDFTGTPEADAYHEQYVTAIQIPRSHTHRDNHG